MDFSNQKTPWNQPIELPAEWKSSVDNATAATNAEADRLAKEKSAWLDRLAKHYFPDHIYELARNGKRLPFVAKWIKEQGYEIREVPSEMLTEFCRTVDGKLTVLAEFRIELRGKQ